VTTLVAALTALTGMVFVHRVARGIAGTVVASWTVVALLFGTSLLPTLVDDALAPLRAASFALVALALAAWWSIGEGPRARGRLALAATAALAGAGLPFVAARAVPHLELWRLPDCLFASPRGLLFESPILWAGFAGLALLCRHGGRRWVVPIAALALVLAGSTARTGAGAPLADGRLPAALPVLGLGLCASLEWLRAAVARRPRIPLAATGASLILWNFLLMEQYRTGRIPRDLTVSLAQVTEGNAAIVSRNVGAPPAWPANWFFAWRHHVTPAKYDVVAGRSLLAPGLDRDDFAMDDPRVDPSLLAEGWGRRASCGGTPCRSLVAGARLFVPLDRTRPLALAVTAGGPGTLAIEINSLAVTEVPLGEALARHEIRGGAGLWRRGVNEVRLSYSGPGEARIAGFSLESGVDP
jgi:hypothetical protein